MGNYQRVGPQKVAFLRQNVKLQFSIRCSALTYMCQENQTRSFISLSGRAGVFILQFFGVVVVFKLFH